MIVNRRTFCKTAGLTVIGTAAGLRLAGDFRAYAAPLPQRQAIHKLTNADGTFKDGLKAYHDALQTLKRDHPLLWTQISNFHDMFCTGAGAEEAHGNWRFLAWHRAYLLTYERVLREVSGDDKVALPYWDWYASDTFPTAFTVGALNHARRNLNSGTTPAVLQPWDRGRRESDNYNVATPFAPPSRDQPQSFFGWRGPDNDYGLPEVVAHGGIHNWVGGIKIVGGVEVADGDMADLDRAANDPCFFSHHANVDRMWEVWKTDVFGGTDSWKATIPTDWKALIFTFEFGGGRSYAYNSMDLLETEAARDADGVELGYTYDAVTPQTPLTRLPIPVAAVEMARRGIEPASKRTLVAENGGDGPKEPVRVPLGALSVRNEARTTAAATFSPSARARATGILQEGEKAAPRSLSPQKSAPPSAEGRVVLRVGAMRIPPRNVQLRFFLNNPDANLETQGSDPSFIGSFNFIPSSEKQQTIEGFELEITDDLRGNIEDLSSAQVTVVPRYAGEGDESVEIDDMVLEVR